eukprot:TRINITY_DN12001_c0_g1_i1.p1 TRINITY_DN12001_c0_g1~~TRINITY_DN12001_c0_g1_i1.p1  ORF type:complete len:811 (+),score=100.54 TRINITY_DN12001_c0_g1_i1:104-2434(+)
MGHGKTCLIRSLIKDDGKQNVSHETRDLTTKSTILPLVFDYTEQKYLLNLVDSSGHIDFTSEVTASLRLTDGVLFVVDCTEGLPFRTELFIRQILSEGLKPMLHINKIDKAISDVNLTAEELYQKLRQIIYSFNQILAQSQSGNNNELRVGPLRGNITFGSGIGGWAFSLPQYANKIAVKTGSDPSDILSRMWGDHYYDPETNRFLEEQESSENGKCLDRYVCQVLLQPLIAIHRTILKGNQTEINDTVESVGVQLLVEDYEDHNPSELTTLVLQRWIPIGNALGSMMIEYAPCPVESQKHRLVSLYSGPVDDDCAKAIESCDPNGPLMMFISKFERYSKQYYAIGRLFSGTLRVDQEVMLLTQDGHNKIVSPSQRIAGIVMMTSEGEETIKDVEIPCGSIIGVLGIDPSLTTKCCTITTSPTAHSIKPLQSSFKPLVCCNIAPTMAELLPRFNEEVLRIRNIEPHRFQVTVSEMGEYIISTSSMFHLQVILNDVIKPIFDDIQLTISPPFVPLYESIETTSSEYLIRTPNSHNRFRITCEPISQDLIDELENSDFKDVEEDKEQLKNVLMKHGWVNQDVEQVWFIKGSNILVNKCPGFKYMNEINESLYQSFEWTCKEGILCEEPLRGIRFNIIEATLHADAVHRGAGQIIPTTKRAFLGAQSDAKPCLVEPIYLLEIHVDEVNVGNIYEFLHKHRGNVINETKRHSYYYFQAHLPVIESLSSCMDDCPDGLRKFTLGQSHPQMSFSHWQKLDRVQYPGETERIVEQVKTRKKLR